MEDAGCFDVFFCITGLGFVGRSCEMGKLCLRGVLLIVDKWTGFMFDVLHGDFFFSSM